MKWIKPEIWDLNANNFTESSLEGEECYVGFFSSLTGLSCVSYLFPPKNEDEEVKVLWKFFCPEEQISKIEYNQNGMSFEKWHKEGLIVATNGNVTDFNHIVHDIISYGEKFEINCIGLDKFKIDKGAFNSLIEHFDGCLISLHFSSSTPCIEYIEEKLKKNKFNHGNNDVATHMLLDVNISSSFANKKQRKIDAVNGSMKIATPYSLFFTIYCLLRL